MVSLVPKWSGAESAISLEEFFSSIEGSAKIGHWAETDCLQVAVLKLTETARTFYFSCPELHGETVTWHTFKAIFRERFKDVRTDQFHYMQLQTARQRRNEGPQEFALGVGPSRKNWSAKWMILRPNAFIRRMQNVCY